MVREKACWRTRFWESCRKAGEDARREKDKMLEQAKHEILSLVLDAAAGSMNKKSDDSALYDEFLKKAGTTENEET